MLAPASGFIHSNAPGKCRRPGERTAYSLCRQVATYFSRSLLVSCIKEGAGFPAPISLDVGEGDDASGVLDAGRHLVPVRAGRQLDIGRGLAAIGSIPSVALERQERRVGKRCGSWVL